MLVLSSASFGLPCRMQSEPTKSKPGERLRLAGYAIAPLKYKND
jgi:hypothetical protein